METDTKSLEEMNALKASFPQLLSQLDKVCFALTQIRDKQQVLDCPMKEQLDSLVDSLLSSCGTLAMLNLVVYKHE